MALLSTYPTLGGKGHPRSDVAAFLKERGILYRYEEVPCSLELPELEDSQLLKRLQPKLKDFSKDLKIKAVDVIRVSPNTANLEQIRDKFRREHTHTEDETRWFLQGQGLFWFNLEGEVFSLLCESGDYLSVPAGLTHWFELAPRPRVVAVRFFENPQGWEPHYSADRTHHHYRESYSWSTEI